MELGEAPVEPGVQGPLRGHDHVVLVVADQHRRFGIGQVVVDDLHVHAASRVPARRPPAPPAQRAHRQLLAVGDHVRQRLTKLDGHAGGGAPLRRRGGQLRRGARAEQVEQGREGLARVREVPVHRIHVEGADPGGDAGAPGHAAVAVLGGEHLDPASPLAAVSTTTSTAVSSATPATYTVRDGSRGLCATRSRMRRARVSAAVAGAVQAKPADLVEATLPPKRPRSDGTLLVRASASPPAGRGRSCPHAAAGSARRRSHRWSRAATCGRS